MKVLELKGHNSLIAFRGYCSLILGLKMLPAYMAESYEDFLSRVESMDEEDQRKILKHGASFVELQKEEVDAMISFCTDANGVPYSKENIKNLGPREMVDAIVSVALEIGRMKISLPSETEKKNLESSQ